MLKKILILLLLIILFHSGTGLGGEILVVQSASMPIYEEALEGFQSAGHPRFKRVIISDLEEKDLKDKIRQIDPPMILTIGIDALSSVKGVKNIPIVYLMVLNPRSILSGEENITGIGMDIPPKRQMEIFSKAMPDIENIGLVYNPDNAGYFVREALKAAGNFNIKLITKETHRPYEVPSIVKGMAGQADAFWILPDITVITPETIEFLLLLSIEHKKPILTFSEKYLQIGALMSITTDPFDMGTQAGEMAKRILSGEDIFNVKEVNPRKAVISINLKIAKKLGIPIGEDISADARIIE